MIEVFVDNSVCRIQGLSQNDLARLRDEASIRQVTGRRIRTKGGKFIPEVRTTFLVGAKGGFPTGLLYLVEEFLDRIKIGYKVRDLRIVPERQPGLFKASFA